MVCMVYVWYRYVWYVWYMYGHFTFLSRWIVPILATHVGAIVGAWTYYIAVGKETKKTH